MIMEYLWNNTDRETRSTRVKTCPNTTLSTIHSIWIDQISNPILRSEKLAILNYMCNAYLCVIALEYGGIINNLIEVVNIYTNILNIICVLCL
jgi:hypothetical protein